MSDKWKNETQSEQKYHTRYVGNDKAPQRVARGERGVVRGEANAQNCSILLRATQLCMHVCELLLCNIYASHSVMNLVNVLPLLLCAT